MSRQYDIEGADPFASPEDEKLNPSFSRTDTAFTQDSTNPNNRKRFQDIRPPRRPERQRRSILKSAPQIQTEYMGMLLHQSMVIEKTILWNFLAAGFLWILLAGFIVLPGTYTNFQESQLVQNGDQQGADLTSLVAASFAKMGLLILASVLCGIGALGVSCLYWKWRRNYIWLLNRLLIPGLLNSLMGLISTLVNVLSKPEKIFNNAAIATTVVTASLAVIFCTAFCWYNFHLLAAVKEDHRKAYGEQDVKDSIADGNNGVCTAV